MRLTLISLVFLMGLTLASMAEGEAPLKTLITGDDSRGWEAVGRLDMAGQAFCTGALIASDLVLTISDAPLVFFDIANFKILRRQLYNFLNSALEILLAGRVGKILAQKQAS